MAASAMAYAYGVPIEVIRKNLLTFPGGNIELSLWQKKRCPFIIMTRKEQIRRSDQRDSGHEPSYHTDRGDYDKDSEYDEWIKAFDGKVRKLVLLGATREDRAKRSCKRI